MTQQVVVTNGILLVPNGDGPSVPYDGSQSCAGLDVYKPGDTVTLDDDEATRLIGLEIVEASP